MGKIHVLRQDTVDQIAAGEVIERPASIVKELVENSIDAKASQITVEIREGGLSLIRVTDDGNGIAFDDVPLAFLRHATSKINNAADLCALTSLGFRGEALSSIAAVSQTELITRCPDEELGCRYRIEGGIETALDRTGAPPGTTFYVRNLFYNTPARKKFLKTPMTEAGHVQEIVTRLALSHSEISFTFISNDHEKLHTPGSGKLEETIYEIYGRETLNHLIPVDISSPAIRVTGLIGDPQLSRSSRCNENYFMNGRYFVSPIISKAVEEAYQPYMMQHKYPFTVLHFTIDPDQIDVNVHPGKMEIRFGSQQTVFVFAKDAVRSTLADEEMIPGVINEDRIPKTAAKADSSSRTAPAVHAQAAELHPVHYKKSDVPQEPEKAKEFYLNEMRRRVTSFHEQEKPQVPAKAVSEEASYHPGKKPAQHILSEEARVHYHLIGQLFRTYWLVEYDDKLLLIDQHAAHEKVLFEQIKNRYAKEEMPVQMTAPPIVLRLTIREQQILRKYSDVFKRMGFEIEPFGGDDFAVRGVPGELPSIPGEDVLMELFDELEDDCDTDVFAQSIQNKLASVSCKAAIKGHQEISAAEMESLIDQLLVLENPYFCPHGRPVMIAVTRAELEKKFKRIV